MIIDNRSTYPPGNMTATACKEQCGGYWEKRWGIKMLTHHHPLVDPRQTETYHADKHLLFDSDKDLVTEWVWDGSQDSFLMRYFPQGVLPGVDRGPGDPEDVRELNVDPFDAYKSMRQRHWTTLSGYRQFTLVTHWQTSDHVDVPVSDEEIEAAKASILREVGA